MFGRKRHPKEVFLSVSVGKMVRVGLAKPGQRGYRAEDGLRLPSLRDGASRVQLAMLLGVALETGAKSVGIILKLLKR